MAYYKVNEDGSVSEIKPRKTGGNNTGGSGSSWGWIITFVIIGVVIGLVKSSSDSNSNDDYVVEEVVEEVPIEVEVADYTEATPTGGASVDIQRVWESHEVYQDGMKGMKIHVKFNADYLKDETLYVIAFFYGSDNLTPLHDIYGDNLSFYSYASPGYDNTIFEDLTIFVPYEGLNMQPNIGTVELSYDISVRTESGNELARRNNSRIYFTN